MILLLDAQSQAEATRRLVFTRWCTLHLTCHLPMHRTAVTGDRAPAAASALPASVLSSVCYERWYFLIYKPTLFLIKCLFRPYCHVIIHDYWKLGLSGCLWSEKELQSQLWTIYCEKQNLRCTLAELRTSERDDANLGGTLSVSFLIVRLCTVVQWPWA